MSRGRPIPTMTWERTPAVPPAGEPTMSDPSISAFLTQLLCAHGGRLAVAELPRHLSLPPAHIAGILREEASRFRLLEEAGVVLVVSSVRLCYNYLKEKCQARDCVRLHLCRFFILGSCFHRSLGNTCGFSHNIQSEVNTAVLKANNISNLDEKDLQVLLLLNDPSFLPEVCMDYKGERKEETCQNGIWCENLHICGFFTRGQCRNSPCNRSHNLLDPNVLRVLETRGLGNETIQNIQLMRTHQCRMARKLPRIQSTKDPSLFSRDRSTARRGRRCRVSDERVPMHHLRNFSTTITTSSEVFPETAAPLARFIQRNTPVVGAHVRSFSSPSAAPTTSMADTVGPPIAPSPQINKLAAGTSVSYSSFPQPPAATTKDPRETQPNKLVVQSPPPTTASKAETSILGSQQTNTTVIEASVYYSSCLSPEPACMQHKRDAQPTISPVPLELSPLSTPTSMAQTSKTSLVNTPQKNKTMSYLLSTPLTTISTANPATNEVLQTNKSVSALPYPPSAATSIANPGPISINESLAVSYLPYPPLTATSTPNPVTISINVGLQKNKAVSNLPSPPLTATSTTTLPAIPINEVLQTNKTVNYLLSNPLTTISTTNPATIPIIEVLQTNRSVSYLPYPPLTATPTTNPGPIPINDSLQPNKDVSNISSPLLTATSTANPATILLNEDLHANKSVSYLPYASLTATSTQSPAKIPINVGLKTNKTVSNHPSHFLTTMSTTSRATLPINEALQTCRAASCVPTHLTATSTANPARMTIHESLLTNKTVSYFPYPSLTATSTANLATLPINGGLQTSKAVSCLLSPPLTSSSAANRATIPINESLLSNKSVSYFPYPSLTATSTTKIATIPISEGLQTNKRVSDLPYPPLTATSSINPGPIPISDSLQPNKAVSNIPSPPLTVTPTASSATIPISEALQTKRALSYAPTPILTATSTGNPERMPINEILQPHKAVSYHLSPPLTVPSPTNPATILLNEGLHTNNAVSSLPSPPLTTATTTTPPTIPISEGLQTNKSVSYIPSPPLTSTFTDYLATIPMTDSLWTNRALTAASAVSSSLLLPPVAAIKFPIGAENLNTPHMAVVPSPLHNDKYTAYPAAAPCLNPPLAQTLAYPVAASCLSPTHGQALAYPAAAPHLNPPLAKTLAYPAAASHLNPTHGQALAYPAAAPSFNPPHGQALAYPAASPCLNPPHGQALAYPAAAPRFNPPHGEALAYPAAVLLSFPPQGHRSANPPAAPLYNLPQRQTLVVHPLQSHSYTPITPICKTQNCSSLCTEVENPNKELVRSSVANVFPSPPAPTITYSAGAGQQNRSCVAVGPSIIPAATSTVHPTSIAAALPLLTPVVQAQDGQPSSRITAVYKTHPMTPLCTVVQPTSTTVDAPVAMSTSKVEMPTPHRHLSASSSLCTLPDNSRSRPYDPQHDISSNASSLSVHGDPNEICIYHIWKFCKNLHKCPKMHYHLPYRWQIYDGNREWKDLTGMKEIEKAYSDPYNTSTIHHNIDFRNMTSSLIPVRRLSTCSSVTKSPDHIFTTEWIWYWKNESGKWIEYGKNDGNEAINFTSAGLESFYQADNKTVLQFAKDLQKYEINFQDMSYRRMVNGTKKDFLRRPKFVSQEDVWNQRVSGGSTENRTEFSAIPEYWDLRALPSVGYKLVDVGSSSSEFKNIQREFEKTMFGFTIQEIKRVQNPSLWHAYQKQLKKMETVNKEKEVLERKLFQNATLHQVDTICRKNFPASYGKGSSFSRDASRMHRICQHDSTSFMFLARVLVGDYVKGHSSYPHPQPKPTNPSQAYDNCVDDEQDPSIFSIFEKDQIYPDYLLKYTEDKTHKTAPDYVRAKEQGLTHDEVKDYARFNSPNKSQKEAKDNTCCIS